MVSKTGNKKKRAVALTNKECLFLVLPQADLTRFDGSHTKLVRPQ